MAIILITGGARSGKSARAERRVRAFPGQPVYIATAEALDGEMAERIAKHRAGGGARLVDCLTLWLSNVMHAELNWEGEVNALAATLINLKSPVVLVTNEVGLGIVPDNALARSFRDAAGIMNQIIAKFADEVEFVVAGLPMKLK